MEKIKYKVTYKCRLCGELYGDLVVLDKNDAITSVAEVSVDGYSCIDNYTSYSLNVHRCKDGSYGLSDFKGLRYWSELRED